MRLFRISAIAAAVLMPFAAGIAADEETAPSVYQELADKFAPIEVENIKPAPGP